MDFAFVTSRLATGAQVGGTTDASELAAAGITHVIDCVAGDPDAEKFAAQPTIAVLWNPTDDDGAAKPPEWFDQSIRFALAALSQPHAKVYAHCAAGVNRGPSTCYAIMRALGWPPEAAETAIRAVRPQVGLAYKGDADAGVVALGWA